MPSWLTLNRYFRIWKVDNFNGLRNELIIKMPKKESEQQQQGKITFTDNNNNNTTNNILILLIITKHF